MPFIDLSHDFADGMPGFTATLPDVSRLRCTARIRPLITHAQSRAASMPIRAFAEVS
jgi:hypothetical protein